MKSNGKIWQREWGYSESFIISAIIVTAGYLFQYLMGPVNLEPFRWPVNLIVLVISIVVIISGNLLIKNSRIIKWISGYPALISAFTIFTIQALMLGLFPQAHLQQIEDHNTFGLNSVATSFPYVFTQVYTLFVLGFYLISRLRKNRRDISLPLILGGFWIALSSAQLGVLDMKRVTVFLYETGSAEYGKDSKGELTPLGFKITLKDFYMEEYSPEILVIDPSAEAEGKSLIKERIEVKEGKSAFVDEWLFEIDKYYPFAQKDSLSFIKSEREGAQRAVRIIAENLKTKEKLSGWLNLGKKGRGTAGLKINNNLAVYLEKPKPRRFVSDLTISSEEETRETTVEVNKPKKVKGWKIYQKGYDKEEGRWSKSSTLEVVKDPWLPMVYLGIYIMIFGSVARLFRKVRTKKEEV